MGMSLTELEARVAVLAALPTNSKELAQSAVNEETKSLEIQLADARAASAAAEKALAAAKAKEASLGSAVNVPGPVAPKPVVPGPVMAPPAPITPHPTV